jgi:hypothetical protein
MWIRFPRRLRKHKETLPHHSSSPLVPALCQANPIRVAASSTSDIYSIIPLTPWSTAWCVPFKHPIVLYLYHACCIPSQCSSNFNFLQINNWTLAMYTCNRQSAAETTQKIFVTGRMLGSGWRGRQLEGFWGVTSLPTHFLWCYSPHKAKVNPFEVSVSQAFKHARGRSPLIATDHHLHNTQQQNGRTSISSAGLEYAIKAMEQLQTARS